MQYPAKVLELEPNLYEGLVLLEIQGMTLRCSYQAPWAFAEAQLQPGQTVAVDLWLVYGEDTVQAAKEHTPLLPGDRKIAGGRVRGRVAAALPCSALRLDCGNLMIDMNCSTPELFAEGRYLQARGTYQVYFPNTAYSYEEIG